MAKQLDRMAINIYSDKPTMAKISVIDSLVSKAIESRVKLIISRYKDRGIDRY